MQPEIYYSMQGATKEVDDIDCEWKYDYIQIADLVKFYIPIEVSISPYLFLGPALGINVDAKLKMDGGDTAVETDSEDVKTFDFGLIFGARVDVGPVTVDARYNLGLMTTDNAEEELDVKNSVRRLADGRLCVLISFKAG
ncbi:MAG: porin family protein [Candidatus Cloacimonadia bacterium]